MKHLFRGLAGISLAYGLLTSASARSLQELPGSWFASEENFGPVFDKNDGEPYFACGDCDRTQVRETAVRSQAQAKLYFEVDPKLFGDAIVKGASIVVRWTSNHSGGDLIVDGLQLTEDRQYLWSLVLTADIKTLDLWRAASHLELTIGIREPDGGGYVARQRYLISRVISSRS